MRARATVYNYGVETDHTYFVGETGVWAHNFCAAFAVGETTGPMDGRLSQAGRPDASEFNLRGDTRLGPRLEGLEFLRGRQFGFAPHLAGVDDAMAGRGRIRVVPRESGGGFLSGLSDRINSVVDAVFVRPAEAFSDWMTNVYAPTLTDFVTEDVPQGFSFAYNNPRRATENVGMFFETTFSESNVDGFGRGFANGFEQGAMDTIFSFANIPTGVVWLVSGYDTGIVTWDTGWDPVTGSERAGHLFGYGSILAADFIAGSKSLGGPRMLGNTSAVSRARAIASHDSVPPGYIMVNQRDVRDLALPRTEGLGEASTTLELLETRAVPGLQGVRLEQRTVGFNDLWQLSEMHGVEFILTRENGSFILRSGSRVRAPIISGVRPIAHTHPLDEFGINNLMPSVADINTLNKAWIQNPAGPRPVSQVITGPGQSTVFRATGTERIVPRREER